MQEQFESYSFQESTISTQQRKRAWLITLNDLFSLLASFFILLYSLSHQDKHIKFEQDVAKDKVIIANQESDLISRLYSVEYIAGLLEYQLKNNPIAGIIINVDNQKLTISLPLSYIFEPDSKTISLKGRSIFYLLGGILLDLRNKIVLNYITDMSVLPSVNGDYSYVNALNKALFVAQEIKEITNVTTINTFILDISSNAIDSKVKKTDNSIYNERIDIIIYETRAENFD